MSNTQHHHPAWSYDSLHVILKFQATIHEMMDLNEIMKPFPIWKPLFKALVVKCDLPSITIRIRIWFNEHCQLFRLNLS